MKGVFGLNSDADLFKKLEWEYERLIADPSNAYVAYNFFVTAWHLLEWKYPDPQGATRNRIRDAAPLLQICEHLAVGAKHFDRLHKRHTSVSHSARSGIWAPRLWAPGTWAKGAWAEWLEISLTGDARKEFGDRINAHDLARHVMDYWRKNI